MVLNKTVESSYENFSMFQRLIEDEKMSDYCIMLNEQYQMVSLTFLSHLL